jgi:RNA polymerase sigma factor (TIGR02999 family)
MRSEGHAHTLTPTALVNEAYLKLAGSGSLTFENRNHFFAIAGRAMRRILVDHARARAAARRGGRTVKPEVSDIEIPIRAPDIQIIALDDALQRLAEISPRQCQVVELRYFVGMSETEVAEILGVTRRTVDRDWKIARAWLHSALNTL